MVVRLSHLPGEPPPRRSNKFSARRTPCQHGHTHASAAEARFCNNYTLMQRAGEIRNLVQQPKFFFTDGAGRRVTKDNGQPIRYTADFQFDEKDGQGGWRTVIVDVKGQYRDDTWLLRRAFFRFFHPDVLLRVLS